jgi:hypothetical protein
MKKLHNIFDSFALSAEKAINEFAVVEQVLENLKVDPATLQSVVEKKDPPDCTLNLNDVVIGIEVVSLVDEVARKLNDCIRKKEPDKSKLDWTKEYYADWTKETFQAKLAELVADKEVKITKGKIEEKGASKCDSFWLVISVDEQTLPSNVVRAHLETWQIISEVFDRIYILLSYEPGRDDSGYPLFALK